MEKEISSGTMFGIVMIALAAMLFLGFCIYDMILVTGGSEYGTLGVSLLNFSYKYLLVSIPLAILGAYMRVKGSLYSVDSLDTKLEKESLKELCDIRDYMLTEQISVPREIPFWKAVRCRLSDVRELRTFQFDRTKKVHIIGEVKIKGNFYVIGNMKLSRGLIVLEQGQEVDFLIETEVSKETALGIFRIYNLV